MPTLSPPGRAQTGAVHVRVPATSANLGPGFDCFGLALGLYDDVVVERGQSSLVVTVEGEGAGDVPVDETNLVVRSLRAGLERAEADVALDGLAVRCRNRIPHARGLGSSAAAVVAGLGAARALVPGGSERLTDEWLLDAAVGLEGHPDNVAACVYGGLTLAWADDGRARAVRTRPADEVTVTVLVPDARASTSLARSLLPAHVPHADAAANAARAALLLEALTRRPDLLMPATEDRLHQRYRAEAMPDSVRLVEELRARSVAAVVSGAGPSVLAFSTGQHEQVATAAPPGWRVLRLPVDHDGVRVWNPAAARGLS